MERVELLFYNLLGISEESIVCGFVTVVLYYLG